MTTRILISITLCATISLAASQSLATLDIITPVTHALNSGSTGAKAGKIGGASVAAAATLGGLGKLGQQLLRGKATPDAINAPVDEAPDAPLHANFKAGEAAAAANISDEPTPFTDTGSPGYFEGYAAELGRQLDAAEAVGDTQEATKILALMNNQSFGTELPTTAQAPTIDHEAYTAGMEQAEQDIKANAGKLPGEPSITGVSVEDQSSDFQRGYAFGIEKAELAAEKDGDFERMVELDDLQQAAFGSATNDTTAPAGTANSGPVDSGLDTDTASESESEAADAAIAEADSAQNAQASAGKLKPTSTTARDEQTGEGELVDEGDAEAAAAADTAAAEAAGADADAAAADAAEGGVAAVSEAAGAAAEGEM